MNANRGRRQFIARCAAAVRTVGLAALLALTALAGDAFGQCSPEVGKATINEFNNLSSNNALGSSFVEIWLKPANPPTSTVGWTLQSFTKTGALQSSQAVASAGLGACDGAGYRATAIDLSDEGSVLLLDANNKLIDVLYVFKGSGSLPGTITPSGGTECSLSDILTDKDIPDADPNRKNISRDPDGTGNWAMSLGSGKNSEQTVCGSNGGGTLPTSAEFDAYDTSIADSPAPGKPRRIKTKVAGTAITLTVTGFAADGSIASTYNGTVTATLEYCSSVSRAAGTISCTAWVAAPAWGGQSVVIAAGKGSVTFPAATSVYEMLRVRIDSSTVTGSPWISSDQFAYRPDSFLVEALDTDDKTAGTTRPINLANFHRAGYDFTLRATARSTGGTTVTGYPAGLLAAAQPPSFSGLAVVAPATVLGGFSAPTLAKLGEGVLSGTARYDEVGSFAVTLEDQHFADVDAADSGTAERYFSGAANLGRFTPDRFALVPVPTVTPTCPAGNFTYMDQPKLGLTFVLEAQNQAGGRTSNYDDAYAFGKGVVGLAARDTGGSDLTARLSDQGGVPSFSAGIFSTPQWALGRFAVNLSAIRFAKLAATTPDGPYDAQLAVRVEDADAIRVSPENVTVGGKSYVAVGASTRFLFGRLWLTNAYGSELLPLPLQVQAQNWSASGWQKNTADSCTQLQTPTAANGGLSNALRNLTTATLASPLVAGDARFVFSAPGAGNRGVVDVASAILLANGTPAVATWLSPSAASARACFGACGPRSPVIHLREVFR